MRDVALKLPTSITSLHKAVDQVKLGFRSEELCFSPLIGFHATKASRTQTAIEYNIIEFSRDCDQKETNLQCLAPGILALLHKRYGWRHELGTTYLP